MCSSDLYLKPNYPPFIGEAGVGVWWANDADAMVADVKPITETNFCNRFSREEICHRPNTMLTAVGVGSLYE